MMDNPHYVTPEEAENKVCVQAMQIVMPMDTAATPCEGPRCMAWRWAKLSDMTDDGKIRLDPVYSATHGYCGMVKL